MRYGRIYKQVVVAVVEPPEGQSIADYVGKDQADDYMEIPDGVDLGHYQQLNGDWLTPEQYAAKKAKGVPKHE